MKKSSISTFNLTFMTKIKETLLSLAKKAVGWLRFNDQGDVDIDRTFQGVFIKTLSMKEISFAVIAIRYNSEESTGKRKMDPGKLYQLLKGYHISDDEVVIEKRITKFEMRLDYSSKKYEMLYT